MHVRIEATDLPGPTWAEHSDVHVALQVGKEPSFAVSAGSPSAGWETEVTVVDGDFRGPAVQGKRGERFLYLTWGAVDGDSFTMFRRLKLMLADLGPGAADAGTAVARLSLTDASGGPLCGRAKPGVVSWQLS